MTSLESTEQKLLPVVCNCRHVCILSYGNSFLTIILFTITQGKQYLQYNYEQYTFWATYSTNSIYSILLQLFNLYILHSNHMTCSTLLQYSNSQGQREKKEKNSKIISIMVIHINSSVFLNSYLPLHFQKRLTSAHISLKYYKQNFNMKNGI